ncbi:MAG: hypothetical protein P8X79_16725 [Reinekea sp.]
MTSSVDAVRKPAIFEKQIEIKRLHSVPTESVPTEEVTVSGYR